VRNSGLIVDLNSLKGTVPDNNSSITAWHKFATKILRFFSNKLGFDFHNLSFSTKEIQQLTFYFYTLELMIRCKEAAVRVSPQVWEGIESRMVTVPE
jgi:hypothetical protein